MAKKKTQSMTAKQLEGYRELLLEKLREITGDLSAIEENLFQSDGELSSMPVHMADIGSDSFEQDLSLGLMAEEKKLVKEILAALKRIEDGTFGICEGLGIPIELNRLEAIPWTRYSLEFARMVEKGQATIGQSFKRRPIDIQRDDDIEDEENEEEDEELVDEEIELTEDLDSLVDEEPPVDDEDIEDEVEDMEDEDED